MFLPAATAVYADSAASEHIEKEPEKKERKRGRPEHSFDMAYTGNIGAFTSDYAVKAVLDDKLFTIGSSLPVFNTLRGDVLTPGYDSLPNHLYSVSDSIMAQSQEYIAFIMISSSSDRPFHSRVLTPAGKARQICDWLAGLTDGLIVRTYQRLFDPQFGSIRDLS